MIGILLVTHGHLSREMAKTVEHVLGTQDHFATICIGHDKDLESKKTEIMTAIENLQPTDGIIICTDLYGSTPSNLVQSFCEDEKIELIAGINVPLLIELMNIRQSCDLKQAVLLAVKAGQKYMQSADGFSKKNCDKKHDE